MSVIAKTRLLKIRTLIEDKKSDAALLTFLPDIRWACGFTGSNAMLLIFAEGKEVAGSAVHFFSDGRYRTQAAREVQDAEIHIPGYKLISYIQKEELLSGVERVLIQADHVTVDAFSTWQELFPHVRWEPVCELVTTEVAQKDESEIQKIRQAQLVTEEVFSFVRGFIRPGMTERVVAAEIVYQHLRRGAEQMAFEPIVASGPNSALPHARPSSRRIRKGDVLLIDMGCFLDGYASDMTRTLFVGEPGEEVRYVYETVLHAQEAALRVARAGLQSVELDRVARDIIKEAGYGEFFGHGLGHGLGLQIHEWPRISYHVDYVLPVNTVVTIEPGIYLPERFGIRVEDIVVLREDGSDNLTTVPKEGIVLDS